MIFIHDTRDKTGKHDHIEDFLTSQGHRIVRSKLYAGDISLLDNQSVCVDIKQGLPEVESNLIHQHERFRAECERAREAGIRLIILIQEPRITCLSDVSGWKNPRRSRWDRLNQDHSRGKNLHRAISPRPPADGATIQKAMRTMAERYGVEWAFCRREDAGRKICELLTVPIDPELEATRKPAGQDLRMPCVSEWQRGRFVSR